MIKLKSIVIKGFKEKSRTVKINFSEESATVIYGENGSGKTTLLKIIHAVFNQNGEYLIEENINEINLVYLNSKSKTTEKKIKITINEDKVNWGANIKDLAKHTSILFGVNRGIIHNVGLDASTIHGIVKNMRKLSRMEAVEYSNDLEFILYDYLDSQENLGIRFRNGWDKLNHISADVIGIKEIEHYIIKEYRKGQKTTSEKVKNAFFNTISSAVDIELEDKNYILPKDFEIRLEKKRNVLVDLVNNLDKSSLQKKLVSFLKKNKKTSAIEDSKIFRAMLVNILKTVEEESIELKSINKLIEVFNSHLYRNKKLVISEDGAHIRYNSSKNDTHGLDKLSSGERHLLTFLTLFLIIGRGRNFYIIDEPEISLNMKWQRELVPLLSELSPNSQIIVATHSPSIANRNSNYLVELI